MSIKINVENLPEEIGNIKLTTTNKIVLKEALQRGIKIQSMDKQRRFKLVFKDQFYVVKNGKIARSFNSKLVIRCTRLKEVTNRLLKSKGAPVPDNIVFSPKDIDRAWAWALPILPVVLKPNTGAKGIHVYIDINSFEEFTLCFNKIIRDYDEVLIEQFVKGTEYRFTLIEKRVVAITRRRPASVLGDGASKVWQLVDNKNVERLNRRPSIHKRLKIDDEAIRVLSNGSFDVDSIPQKGERVFLRKNSNISTGGDAIDTTDTMDKGIVDLIEKAVSSIPELNVCGADVIIDNTEKVDGIPKATIIEINYSPMLSMHHYPWEGKSRNVAKVLIDAMFPSTAIQNISGG